MTIRPSVSATAATGPAPAVGAGNVGAARHRSPLRHCSSWQAALSPPGRSRHSAPLTAGPRHLTVLSRRCSESLSENDVLGVLDHLAPGEREVVKDATVDYVDELSRLGVVSDDLDLSAVPGFEFSYGGMTYAPSRPTSEYGSSRSPAAR